jgi:hypothetical protein
MLGQLGSAFRKLSGVIVLVGVMVTFYTLLFAGVPTDRRGRPKPPLAEQLLSTLAVVAVGLPGVAWGVVRATRGKQRTPWE